MPIDPIGQRKIQGSMSPGSAAGPRQPSLFLLAAQFLLGRLKDQPAIDLGPVQKETERIPPHTHTITRHCATSLCWTSKASPVSRLQDGDFMIGISVGPRDAFMAHGGARCPWQNVTELSGNLDDPLKSSLEQKQECDTLAASSSFHSVLVLCRDALRADQSDSSNQGYLASCLSAESESSRRGSIKIPSQHDPYSHLCSLSLLVPVGPLLEKLNAVSDAELQGILGLTCTNVRAIHPDDDDDDSSSTPPTPRSA